MQEKDSEYSIFTKDMYASHPLLSRLLTLHDIPETLYIQGTLPDVTIDEYGRATPRILTIVGSRKHTNYGKDVLEKLLPSLSGAPVIIISGLALGIDGLAHKGALTNTITTIAIPGSGLDEKVLYPHTHVHLAREIVSKGGALISELSPSTSAAQWTFPSRNRIMSALSDAVLVIEAEEKSGTLITARQALELGRDIGVIPGNIFSSTSLGTNALARDGASIITSPADLFDLLHLSYETPETKTLLSLTEEESILMNLLQEPRQKDILLSLSNLSATTFLVTLSSLEMKGYIHETFGEVRKVV
jgi:DNA processing protein